MMGILSNSGPRHCAAHWAVVAATSHTPSQKHHSVQQLYRRWQGCLKWPQRFSPGENLILARFCLWRALRLSFVRSAWVLALCTASSWMWHGRGIPQAARRQDTFRLTATGLGICKRGVNSLFYVRCQIQHSNTVSEKSCYCPPTMCECPGFSILIKSLKQANSIRSLTSSTHILENTRKLLHLLCSSLCLDVTMEFREG